MGIETIFQTENWKVPFHFWSVVMFALGSMVGSFLNVCVYRLPRGLSVVRPPSHCPQCQYAIPWYLNVPVWTWLWLRGKCANCGAAIPRRYFLVELLTGLLFLGSWLVAGPRSPWVALIYCLVMAGLVVATFIDFEHFIIPDEITLGGMAAGVVCSVLVPELHAVKGIGQSLMWSVVGLAAGWGIVYGIVRLGKLMFGRHHITLPGNSRIIFGETSLHLPDQEVPYEAMFYRKGDMIRFEAKTLELVDRCRWSVPVRLWRDRLEIGTEVLKPEDVVYMEAVTDRIVLPREAMGLGDVKLMGAIGAFLGWQAAVFALLVSSVIGGVVGLLLIAFRRREWSSLIPYGPYIALAAVLWMLGGEGWFRWWWSGGWLRY